MAEPRLVDSVTLRHFGIVNRLDVLENRLEGYENPRWTEAVQSEIFDHREADGCDRVLAAQFMGTAHEVPLSKDLFVIQRVLTLEDGSSSKHLGEAELIWTADRLNGSLITDDGPAFDFAVRRFGHNRVLDTIDLLRESVAADEMSPYEAKQLADAIRNSGRFLRAGHPPSLTSDYFAHH
jgi:hypothetical protein